jgi:hypothetical protein
MRTRRIAILAAVLVVAACAKSETGGNKRDTMTKRQRDSVLGQSGLPGAQGISKAMRAADSVKSQTSALDSITP